MQGRLPDTDPLEDQAMPASEETERQAMELCGTLSQASTRAKKLWSKVSHNRRRKRLGQLLKDSLKEANKILKSRNILGRTKKLSPRSRQLRHLSRKFGDSLPTCTATSKEDDNFPKHFAYMIITGSTSPTTADDEVWNDVVPRNATVGSFPGNGENLPNGSPQLNTP